MADRPLPDARGLTGPRYLLAVLVLAVLSTVPMMVAIGAARAVLEPVVPSTTSVRPFVPSVGQSPLPVAPAERTGEPPTPAAEPDAAEEARWDAADEIAASCAAKSGDLAIVCRFPR